MQRWGLVLAFLFCVGCGKKLGPGKTPKETIENFQKAVQRMDLAATYDMCSARVRKQIDRVMNGLKSMVKALPEEIVSEAGWDGIADKSPREMLAAAVDRARDVAPEMVDTLKSMQMIVMNVKVYGNEAEVEVSTLFGGNETTTRLPMVKEGGVWLIDSDQTLTGLPIDLTPPQAACVTPT